jgi:phosphoribosylformylglycinamidine synthase|tara:strand:- start:632 stop:913 length:282 start_codon:yes stop_codon:yes gene_type:complete
LVNPWPLKQKRNKLKISIIVTLKKAVLDPQGKVIKETLKNMNFQGVDEVRQGKYFEIDIQENDFQKAKLKAEELCEKLLANLVIEEYQIIEKK